MTAPGVDPGVEPAVDPGVDEPAAGERAADRAAALLSWGERHLRPLPWRATRDPWAVLVSEVMAQQTQVDRVIPRWHEFLARFPDPGACAAAPPGEVLRLWSGLGYNRRALSLHGCAVAVVERHGGRLPGDLDALLALPGVGPYTARAVLAFAFERPIGVVDTNVGRVLARWAGRPLPPAEAQAAADDLVAGAASAAPAPAGVAPPGGPAAARSAGREPVSGTGERAWRWNQSLMELGAVVCDRRTPDCGACPARSECAWAQAGTPDPDPAVGSAGVSTGQPRFDGSDRQGRGRLVAAAVAGPVPVADVAVVMGWPDDPARADRVAIGLLADGLVVRDGDVLRLP